MSWDETKLEALVSDNVASVNAGDEAIFASRRNVRRKGQAMSDAAAARLKAQGIDPESFEPISLGIGVPAVDTVPKEELALSMQRAVLQGDDSIGRGHSVWGYGWANPIREALAAHFSRVRGVEVTTGHFLADGGSSGAIGSIARAFLSPGDAVISERPGYVGSMDAFTAQPGVRYVGVDLNDDGLDMAELASVVSELKAQGNKAKMIYIQSLYHNPRGTGYTIERMRELLTYCAEHSILILNDEAYYGLHLDPESEPVFLSTIAEEMGLSLGVITACTFSKTIAPGLRAGFSFADPLIISQISSVKMGSVSTVLLLALADFIERGEWSASTPYFLRLCKDQAKVSAQISSNQVCACARQGQADCEGPGGVHREAQRDHSLDRRALLALAHLRAAERRAVRLGDAARRRGVRGERRAAGGHRARAERPGRDAVLSAAVCGRHERGGATGGPLPPAAVRRRRIQSLFVPLRG